MSRRVFEASATFGASAAVGNVGRCEIFEWGANPTVCYRQGTRLAPALLGYAGKGPKKRPEDYRCLILGSTELEVEKSLWGLGFVGEIVSSDIAEKAMARCRDQARARGQMNVNFVVADLNTDRFEGTFDFVIANGILHHIIEQERCLDMLNSALAPDGYLIASEFTGPRRFQLPQAQVDWTNSILRLAPEELRMPLTLDRPFSPPSEELLISIDPTEAISGHLLDANLRSRFDVVERRLGGGTLTTYLHEWIDYRKTNEGPFEKWMRAFVDVENRLIASGMLNSDFTFYVARKFQRAPAWSKIFRRRPRSPAAHQPTCAG
jgi:SAM-dependent methyltransferase